MAGARRQPPERYTVEITVTPQDESGLRLNVVLEDILRSDILADDYKAQEVSALVRSLEYHGYGIGENSEESAQGGDPAIQSRTNHEEPDAGSEATQGGQS